MEQNTTPVLLLTGYLGSGKTTLLNRILGNQRGIRFAVIVNDIGEVNIDASLIAREGIVGQSDDSLVPLQNGCICCTLKMDLVQQLSDLVKTHSFDYIVIEASGICEPAPIAQTICAYPQIYPNLAKEGVAKLDSVVTVVDALRLRDEFAGGSDLEKEHIEEDDLESLVIQQVDFAIRSCSTRPARSPKRNWAASSRSCATSSRRPPLSPATIATWISTCCSTPKPLTFRR